MPEPELVAYVNGEIVAESEARISVFDRGFLHGDAAFDTARTFSGRVFKLEEHVDRLLKSCRYLELDPGLDRTELLDLTHDLDPYDLAVADEAFLTSTSLCIGPVSSYNRRRVGDGSVPGPVTQRLLDAYGELVGLDIAGQYLAQLDARVGAFPGAA
jgi:branched-subunit amino acid aminotransferase/4-amino-4-deoxychorismate lyase